MKEETMNSCKFRFLGLVVTTLFITGLIATPTEITTMKDASAVIKQSDLRTEKVGEVITASERSSALGINGGSLNAKEGEVIRMTSTKEGVVFNLNKTNAPFAINDREGNVIQNEGRPDCPAGTIADCSGDGDCCPESWIGDGFADCEDQAFGCDLTCYDNDGGDCADGGTTTTTTGAACDEVIWTTDMTFDWYCTGSPGSGSINFCANGTADLAGYTGTWTSGNGDVPNGDGLCPGTGTLESDLTFQFDNYATIYQWDTEGDDIYTPGAGYHDDQGYNGEGNADGLTCINGSDACLGGGTTTGGTTTGGDCPAGTVEDCSGDGDCCPESWIGDGFEDCEDQAFGCDLTCYDNDGGDCGGGTTTTTTTTGGTDALASYTITFDWYCTGSPGSSTLDIFEDGTALLAGSYTGTWMSGMGDMPLGDGLCPGAAFTNDLSFMFDNYATVYMWNMEDGLCSSGSGYHDDTAYNGEGNVDGLTDLGFVAGNCEDTDPCDGQADGDANGDGAVNVLDVVSIVNYILAGGDGLDDCGAAVSDYNGDGAVNVLDVVAIVNMILAGGGRTVDATNATMIQTVNGVDISADGYIGGVQMTLSHGADFSIELTDNAYVAEYKTNGTSTMLIVINPENEEIFRSSGDFTIDEVLVTNSQEFIDVAKELPVSFTLSNAYPNPFNPTTTLTLDIADQSFASVKVFNLRGEVVGVLMNDMVNAGSYTMTWDASNLSSGVYMIKAEANGQIASQKVMLVK
jgi:hypothetical protein